MNFSWHKIYIYYTGKNIPYINKLFMKRNLLALLFLSTIAFTACNNDGDTDDAEDTTSMNMDADTTTAPVTNTTPLESTDVDFVIKAAEGGIMEVEAGNIAQQNSTNERVKAYATMMVRDHSNANNELKGMVSTRGVMIPEDSIRMKHKSHLEMMQKMKGKAFDNHYMGMMVTDHKKTVEEFEKAANNLKDADLKAWAAKTLPVLKMHNDSAQAINKVIK